VSYTEEIPKEKEAPALRFCAKPLWWRENLELTQDMVAKAEQVECESFGRRYSKYAAVLHDGRDVVCARVSDVLRDAIGFGEAMLQWGVGQTIEFLKDRIHPWESYSPSELNEAWMEAEKARFKTRDEAAEYGTRAHELIELWCHTGTLCFQQDGRWLQIDINKESEPVQRAFAAFRKFWDKEGLESVAIEQWLVDVERGYGGTIDFVAKDKNGHFVLIDWKTSKAFRDKYLLQVGAYDWLWSVAGPGAVANWEPIRRAYICRIDKVTAEYQLLPVFVDDTEREALRAQWTYTLSTFRWLKNAGKLLSKWNPK